MKTTLHHYSFDISKPEQKKLYFAMVHEIESNGPEARGHKMHSISDRFKASKAGTSEPVEIETECVFDNQWNSTTDRLFDWFEEAIFRNGIENKTVKRGHWLEITPEMASLRTNTFKCGYCGKHYGPNHEEKPSDGFCRACLDNSYLTEDRLHLLRLLPLVGHQDRDNLTKEELEHLMPLYVARQTTGKDSRAKAKRDKERADVLADYDSTTKAATIERDGFLWLWDHGMNLDNVIYYSHTGVFCFGWREPVSASVESAILDFISEFPFAYEIKSVNGVKKAA